MVLVVELIMNKKLSRYRDCGAPPTSQLVAANRQGKLRSRLNAHASEDAAMENNTGTTVVILYSFCNAAYICCQQPIVTDRR